MNCTPSDSIVAIPVRNFIFYFYASRSVSYTHLGNSFDIGGPVSKGFMAITLQLADAGFSKGPLSIGSVVPAIGFGLATLLDKFVVRKHLFDEDLQASGTPALILGLLCVAEGGLPLLLSDLLFMIPINCLGGGLAAASALSLIHISNEGGRFAAKA